jgi:hypothetical protein
MICFSSVSFARPLGVLLPVIDLLPFVFPDRDLNPDASADGHTFFYNLIPEFGGEPVGYRIVRVADPVYKTGSYPVNIWDRERQIVGFN